MLTNSSSENKVSQATTPVIVSASRSTDIPAFYTKWFINRLAAGYAVWYNPFNQQPMKISFEKTKVVVFWTKNPAPLIPYLHKLDKRSIHYYFQFTLNDYEAENFEPNVPTLTERVETFRQLSALIGKERVIWRFDPIIMTSRLHPRDILRKVWKIGNLIKGCTEKLVFSFVDVKNYRKVQNNLIKDTDSFTRETIDMAEPNDEQIREIVEGLAKLREHWKREDGWDLALATCAEKIDLEEYGVEHNKCIDGELMERLFANDKELIYYLRTGKLPEPDLFGGIPELPLESKNLKDKGQRKLCGCMISKDIGMYNTCRHLCAYCYANTSRNVVMSNKDKHSDESESIIG